jgi:hypothetical protein
MHEGGGHNMRKRIKAFVAFLFQAVELAAGIHGQA